MDGLFFNSFVNDDDSDDGTLARDVFDQEKPKKLTRSLNISKNYVRGWDTRDAFREFYQNWRDAIIETFNLDRHQFAPRFVEDNKYITVTVSGPDSTRLSPRILGFIRFCKIRGSVTIVNANAELQPGDLELGQTSKENKDRLIGCHGEGFKFAALVMIRAGYKSHIESSNHNFNFSFKGANNSKFHCNMNPSRKIHVPLSSEEDGTLHLTAYKPRIWKDVAVRISPLSGVGALKISRHEFIRWLRVSIDIHGFSKPSELIETEHGDLILEKKYANKIYFKGLLLPESASGGEAFECGYNFKKGGLNRDRQRLTSIDEGAQLLCRIWEAAIKKSPGIARPRYIALLQSKDNVLDVKNADKHLDIDTSEVIWNLLLIEAGPTQFYYCDENRNDAEVIKESLKRDPIGIPRTLWRLLRRHSLIRTADEERIHRFRNAKSVLPPETKFARSVRRSLYASLLLDKSTSRINVTFIHCNDSDVEMYFEPQQKLLKVSQKWLFPNEIHAEHGCRISEMGAEALSSETFLCEHIAETLLSHALKEIASKNAAPKAATAWFNQLCGEARAKLRQMPRNVVAEQSSNANEIIVSWEDGESQHFSKLFGKKVQYHVTLHERKCLKAATMLLHTKNIRNEGSASCGCKEKLVSQERRSVAFGNLDPSKRYFPMVAENGQNTFYGISPESIFPPAHSKPSGVTTSIDIKPELRDDAEDIEAENSISAFEDEEKEWQAWEKEIFPRLFQSCTPSYTPFHERCIRPLATLKSRRLQWRFERYDYIMVTMKCPHKLNELSRHLLRVHGGIAATPDTEDDEGSLFVTQYSFLRKSPIFHLEHVMERDPEVDDKEVLLHFHDFDTMGERSDATIVQIKDIIDAKPVDIDLLSPFEPLVYTVDIPKDLSQIGLFCRFAVRCGGSEDSACLTPVGSHLLPRSKHWKLPIYSYQPRPVVLDFSPGVVGLAEGLRQSGGIIQAGIGFNPESHLTWRAAYPTAEVYDAPRHKSSDLRSLWLGTNPDRADDHDGPSIGIISIPDKGVPEREDQMRADLKILDNFQAIIDIPSRKLDFFVFTFPSWIFSEDAYTRLFNGIYTLLQNRYCIHLKKIAFAKHCIPQDGMRVILLASSIYSQAHWNEVFDNNSTDGAPTVVVKDCIGDLAFPNPEVRDKTRTEHLACRHPITGVNIYNHRTGRKGLGPTINWNAALTMRDCPYRTQHPERGDMLTVREIARVQGFADSFVFMGSNKRQYEEAITAFPPPVGKKLWGAIMMIVREFRSWPEEDDSSIEGALRGQKRRREG